MIPSHISPIGHGPNFRTPAIVFVANAFFYCIRVFLAEAKVLLARTFWNFELQLDPKTPEDWMDQKAYLVFEPKTFHVQLTEKSID